jgi:hypothetical protein
MRRLNEIMTDSLAISARARKLVDYLREEWAAFDLRCLRGVKAAGITVEPALWNPD